MGKVSVLAGTWNTVSCPTIEAPAPSVIVTRAVPTVPGSPEAVEPLTRTCDWPTTLTLRPGSSVVACSTMSTRPVLFCTASIMSIVVSSWGRTNAVTGAIESGTSVAGTVTRMIADCSARVSASCTL